ncbi:conjugal transfer protein TraH [Neisseria sp. Ec49-e6-T10]|uniref:conjugal transfer protein TraH n=1 Tax=Neisseria sp. Ec49-e6-T10 TaxID=3140744 RepID=UPI003EB69A2F
MLHNKFCFLPTRALAISVCLLFYHSTSQANIQSDMQDMFDSAGVSGNYTKAGSFHNQSMNMYTGGSLSVRAPVSNLSPISIQLPRIEAGCGGIDFFAGAFSFVNKEQFVQFTRNLGNNAAGVAFEIALDSLDPLVGGAIDKIRKIAEEMNRFNMNSCSAAKQMVGGIMGEAAESIQQQCKAKAIEDGSAADASEAEWYCRSADKVIEKAKKAREKPNSANSGFTFTGGNLMREALVKHLGSIDEKDLDILMSISGTVIAHPITDKKDNEEIEFGIETIPPTIKDIRTFLNGSSDLAQTGEPSQTQTVQVNLVHCTSGDEGLYTKCSTVNQAMPSVRYYVRNTLKKLMESIRGDAGLSEAERLDAVNLIETTQLPLLKIIINDAVIGTNLLQQYEEIIVYEYMFGYTLQLENKVSSSLGKYQKIDKAIQPSVDQIYANLRAFRATLITEKNAAYSRASAENQIVNYLKNFDNHWKANFPGLANNMAFELTNRI